MLLPVRTLRRGAVSMTSAISPTAGTEPTTIPLESLTRSSDDRRAVLDRALQLRGAQGWRIESRSDFQATIAKGERINNTLHLILTLVTAGLWALVWIIVAITGGIKRMMVTIDEYGNVIEQKL
jgi:hypothetical protein